MPPAPPPRAPLAGAGRPTWPGRRGSSPGLAEAVYLGQGDIRTVEFGERDRAIEPHDRRRVGGEELVVERHDRGPIGVLRRRRIGVNRVDSSQYLILPRCRRPGRHGRDPLPHQGVPLGDQPPVPPAAVLLREGHEVSGRAEAGRAPSVREDHQRQESCHLSVAGAQIVQQSAQADRLIRQPYAHRVRAVTGEIALVEDEEDHDKNAVEALAHVGLRRHRERNPRILDLRLGARDAPGHRRLRAEEGARDLSDRQPTEQPQRQRHP